MTAPVSPWAAPGASRSIGIDARRSRFLLRFIGWVPAAMASAIRGLNHESRNSCEDESGSGPAVCPIVSIPTPVPKYQALNFDRFRRLASDNDPVAAPTCGVGAVQVEPPPGKGPADQVGEHEFGQFVVGIGERTDQFQQPEPVA